LAWAAKQRFPNRPAQWVCGPTYTQEENSRRGPRQTPGRRCGALLCRKHPLALASLIFAPVSAQLGAQPLEPLAALAFAAVGACAGLLAGLLGIGGGAVIVPALLVLLPAVGADSAWTPHQAVATSLATVVAAGSASALSHHRRGAVRWRLFRQLVPGILIGAAGGALLAGLLPSLWLKRLFALFLLVSGARLLLAGAARLGGRPFPGHAARLAAGGGIGALSAVLGIGGGIMLVPYLAHHGLPLRNAVATSSACGVPLALAGTLAFVVSGWQHPDLPAYSIGFVLWPAALAIAAAAVPMATVGARLAHRLPTFWLRRVFAVLLLVVGTRLLLT
jgi:uncharacterized membrane protein YfcA